MHTDWSPSGILIDLNRGPILALGSPLQTMVVVSNSNTLSCSVVYDASFSMSSTWPSTPPSLACSTTTLVKVKQWQPIRSQCISLLKGN